MLHMGNKSINCKSCVPFKGFKFIGIIIAGCIIGSLAMNFVGTPPSVKLIKQSRHDITTNTIIIKLNNMEKSLISIKHDLLSIKNHLNRE